MMRIPIPASLNGQAFALDDLEDSLVAALKPILKIMASFPARREETRAHTALQVRPHCSLYQ